VLDRRGFWHISGSRANLGPRPSIPPRGYPRFSLTGLFVTKIWLYDTVIESVQPSVKAAVECRGGSMRLQARIFGLAMVVGSILASGGVAADDAHTRALDTSIPSSSVSAPSGGDKSSADDLSSRIDQLEANRTAAGQTKSPISLSVSGWVSQEVTIRKWKLPGSRLANAGRFAMRDTARRPFISCWREGRGFPSDRVRFASAPVRSRSSASAFGW